MRELQERGSSSTSALRGEVFLLSPEQVILYWENIRECLEEDRTLWEDYHTIESLFEEALGSRIQVWVLCYDDGVKCVFFSRVVETRERDEEIGRRTMVIFWMWGVGAIENIRVLAPAIERFARYAKCSKVSVIGRKGWKRVLERWGFKHEAIVMEMPVPKESVFN